MFMFKVYCKIVCSNAKKDLKIAKNKLEVKENIVITHSYKNFKT